MDNLSGTPNYTGIIRKSEKNKKDGGVEIKEENEIDPELKNKIIEEYKKLLADCEELYNATNNKNLGDLWISLYTLRKQADILSLMQI
jgi:hypothetical protein